MTQQASYVFTEQGETFAVVFEGDAIIAAVPADNPTPENLLGYVQTEDVSDPWLVERLNQGLSFGGVAEIDHLGTFSV